MGIQINGNNDTISALDGSWTAEGATTFTGAAGFNGKVSIGGTLTYEDVTNIDSIGIITAKSGIHLEDYIFHKGDTDTSIGFPSADTLFVKTAGLERLRITSAGKMVSTISSPDPYNTVNTNLELVNGAGNQGAGSRIDFTCGNGKAHIQSQVTGGNSNSGLSLVFATSPDANGSDERLRITSDGKIGINESANINGRLHVQHDALAENILYATRYNDQGNDKPILAITEATMTGWSASGLVIGNHNRDIHIGQVFDSSAAVTTGSVTGIRISSGGNVGIGSAIPGEKLDVNGSIRSLANNYPTMSATFDARYDATHLLALTVNHNSSTPQEVLGTWADSGGANPRTVINATSAWKVGIGTVNPAQKLDVATGGNAFIRLGQDSDNPKIEFYRTTGSGSNYYGAKIQHHTGYLTVSLAGSATWGNHSFSEKIKLHSGGNVKITSNSEPQLDVHSATSGAGASIRVQSAGAYAYHMAVSSNIHWRWGMPTGTADWVLRESTNNRNRFWVDTGNGAYFQGTSHTNLEIRSASASTKALIQTVQDSDVRIGASTNHPLALYAGALEKARLDTSGRLHIGSTNNTGSNTKLVVGAGNNVNTTCIINTGDVDTDALTLSNWDGSTTTNKIMMHFDCSGIGGYNIGMPAASDTFVIEDDGGDVHFTVAKHGDVAVANQAPNSYDNPATNVNTVVEANENRSGVYWLNFNGRVFRAYIKANWIQDRNWVLAAKYFDFQDMPSGSSLWTNDTFINESDFNLWGGLFSKYPAWRYFSFNRLAMQMGNRMPPIMGFNSNQTLYGAFSGGRANNGGGVTADSTWPSLSGSSITYHGMPMFMGPDFYDVGGSEDRIQSYGLNKWANNSTQSTAGQNRGSEECFASHRREHTDQNGGGNADNSLQYESLKGWGLTVEDHHPQINGVDSIARAGAWIGCPLDEGGSSHDNDTSNSGSDSGFGFGWCTGNPGRTGTAGYAEWGNGSQSVNTLPAYIWLSID